MPTNHTTPTAPASRLCRLAVDALQAADELLAHPFDGAQAELYISPATSMVAIVLDRLEDGLYQAEKLDQGHRAAGESV